MLLRPLKILIPKKNVIIFSSYSPYKYGGGPKYLFEKMSRNKKFKVYWATESGQIKEYLRKKNLLYISKSNLFNLIKTTMFAKIIVSSGTAFFDYCYLIATDKKVIKISTMHGSGPKLAINKYSKTPDVIRAVKNLNKYTYVSFCSKYAETMIGRKQFGLNQSQTLLLGNPKNDQFFNRKKINFLYKKKKLIKKIFNIYNKKAKYIYYAPTHRPYKYPLPIKKLLGFNFKLFDKFLKKNNIYFIHSSHVLNDHHQTKYNFDNIKYISYDQFPLIDNNKLFFEIDIFITDCSTLSTEAAIISKPQIFVFPDYDKYLKQGGGFVENYKRIMPGPMVTNFKHLKKIILQYSPNNKKYLHLHKKKINHYLEKYYSKLIKNSNKLFENFFNRLVN